MSNTELSTARQTSQQPIVFPPVLFLSPSLFVVLTQCRASFYPTSLSGVAAAATSRKSNGSARTFFFLLSVTCLSGVSPSTQRILNLHVFFLFHGFPSRFLTLAFLLLSFLLFSLLVLMLLYNEHTYHIPVNHALSVS
jgi:hypothetical protein